MGKKESKFINSIKAFVLYCVPWTLKDKWPLCEVIDGKWFFEWWSWPSILFFSLSSFFSVMETLTSSLYDKKRSFNKMKIFFLAFMVNCVENSTKGQSSLPWSKTLCSTIHHFYEEVESKYAQVFVFNHRWFFSFRKCKFVNLEKISDELHIRWKIYVHHKNNMYKITYAGRNKINIIIIIS